VKYELVTIASVCIRSLLVPNSYFDKGDTFGSMLGDPGAFHKFDFIGAIRSSTEPA